MEAKELPKYLDQKVRVYIKDEHKKADRKEPVEGRLTTVNKSGVFLVQSGQRAELVFSFEAESIEIVTSSADDLAQTVLKPVKINAVRRHLVNYHGWSLEKVNNITDDVALAQHDQLHAADPKDVGTIGHRHEK